MRGQIQIDHVADIESSNQYSVLNVLHNEEEDISVVEWSILLAWMFGALYTLNR